ncbi:MAG: aminodeoxychorismate synthase component I [Candidatus Krumholzibacteria bacterium]|nr:aminodeoxychorismate synthase component I [Candidatus Krumholzibacteria bacterium]
MTDFAGHNLCTEIELAVPFWRCAELFPATESAFLLDSGLDPARLGRYSYVGGRPSALLTGRRMGPDTLEMDLKLQTWRRPDGQLLLEPRIDAFQGDPFVALRDLAAKYPVGPDAPSGEHAVPFASGLVGCFGYETAYAIEKLPSTGTDDLGLPEMAFMVVDEVLVHDHTRQQTFLLVTGRGAQAAQQAAQRTAAWQADLAALSAKAPLVVNVEAKKAPVRAHFDRQQYKAAVEQCRQHILAGDVFEVCLTQRLEMDLPGTAWDLYGVLRAINPAPFAAYLQFPDFQVVSASPERFLQLGADGAAESRPIKGTRPRGATPAEDARLKAELGSAEKDLAENIMIVDLVRNDLGKVCRIGSVSVPELQVVESYATVHQLVSTVRGELKPEYDAFDLVRACFPGGSMTGAPKIEAMKIIDSIEPVKRGVYSGALGFIAAGGAMDLGMVIRTVVCQNGIATFGVGGAVVSDSDPDAEYEETMDKARAMITAISALSNGGAA